MATELSKRAQYALAQMRDPHNWDCYPAWRGDDGTQCFQLALYPAIGFVTIDELQRAGLIELVRRDTRSKNGSHNVYRLIEHEADLGDLWLE